MDPYDWMKIFFFRETDKCVTWNNEDKYSIDLLITAPFWTVLLLI